MAHSKLILQINNPTKPLDTFFFQLFDQIVGASEQEQKVKFMLSNSCHRNLDEISHSGKLSIWIPYTEKIATFIKDLLINAVNNCQNLIKDPFSNDLLHEAHIWFDMKYIESTDSGDPVRRFHIRIANKMKDKLDYQRALKTRHMKKLSDYQLDIDLKYEVSSTDKEVLITNLTFPTI